MMRRLVINGLAGVMAVAMLATAGCDDTPSSTQPMVKIFNPGGGPVHGGVPGKTELNVGETCHYAYEVKEFLPDGTTGPFQDVDGWISFRLFDADRRYPASVWYLPPVDVHIVNSLDMLPITLDPRIEELVDEVEARGQTLMLDIVLSTMEGFVTLDDPLPVRGPVTPSGGAAPSHLTIVRRGSGPFTYDATLTLTDDPGRDTPVIILTREHEGNRLANRRSTYTFAGGASERTFTIADEAPTGVSDPSFEVTMVVNGQEIDATWPDRAPALQQPAVDAARLGLRGPGPVRPPDDRLRVNGGGPVHASITSKGAPRHDLHLQLEFEADDVDGDQEPDPWQDVKVDFQYEFFRNGMPLGLDPDAVFENPPHSGFDVSDRIVFLPLRVRAAPDGATFDPFEVVVTVSGMGRTAKAHGIIVDTLVGPKPASVKWTTIATGYRVTVTLDAKVVETTLVPLYFREHTGDGLKDKALDDRIRVVVIPSGQDTGSVTYAPTSTTDLRDDAKITARAVLNGGFKEATLTY